MPIYIYYIYCIYIYIHKQHIIQIYNYNMYVHICTYAISMMNLPKSGCEPLTRLMHIQVQPLIGLEVPTKIYVVYLLHVSALRACGTCKGGFQTSFWTVGFITAFQVSFRLAMSSFHGGFHGVSPLVHVHVGPVRRGTGEVTLVMTA